MAQLIDIQKVVVGPRDLTATVRVADGAPLMTSEDVEATARVYWLMPQIATHACLGDAGSSFQDVMGDTELAHLLEHVTIELLARTNMAGDISHGRTRATDQERTYEVTLACPDDVLVTGALSSAAWILQWAYSGGSAESGPDVDAIVDGLVQLTEAAFSMEGAEGEGTEEPATDDVDAGAAEPVDVEEAVVEEAPEPAAVDEAGEDAADVEVEEAVSADEEAVAAVADTEGAVVETVSEDVAADEQALAEDVEDAAVEGGEAR